MMSQATAAFDMPDIEIARSEKKDIVRNPTVPKPVDDAHSLCRTDVWCEIIQKTFGHQPVFISHEPAGTAPDTIPFFLVRTPFGKKKMISPPYQGFDGGFTASDPSRRNSLIVQIIQQAKRLGVRYVEMRSLLRIPELNNAGFIETAPLLVSEVPLESEDANWMRLSPSHRRNVRMAEKKGVLIESARDWGEMEVFFDQLAQHYKHLGIPFFGIHFFEQVWDRLVLQNQGALLIARHNGVIIGGLLMLHSGKTMIVKYSVTRHDGEYAHINASYGLYWEAIRQGAALGFSKLNMGITGEHNVGLREFKLRFGASEEQAYFYYYSLRGPIPDYKKLYGSYKLIKQCWKMMPMGLATLLGDQINRWVC